MKFILIKKECQTKDGKRKFTKYLTKMKSSVDSSEEKYVTVKFNADLTSQIKWFTSYGMLHCKDEDVQLPIGIEPYEKNGKTVYPYVWVNNFEKFDEMVRQKTTIPVFVTVDEPDEPIDEISETKKDLPF